MLEITLQKILPQEVFKKTPVLLDGANATPPEDCGGMCGYADLLETLADPKNLDHKDTLEWLGIKKASEFNPKKSVSFVSFCFPDPTHLPQICNWPNLSKPITIPSYGWC